MKEKGLTLRDQNFINATCRSIAKCERHGVKDKELRQQVYMLGLYTFRKYHKAGIPIDFRHPGLNTKILSKFEYMQTPNGYNDKNKGMDN